MEADQSPEVILTELKEGKTILEEDLDKARDLHDHEVITSFHPSVPARAHGRAHAYVPFSYDLV